MITVLSNSSGLVHSNPLGGGGQTAPTIDGESTSASLGATGLSSTAIVDLSDVNTSGLNDNDVLVFDALTGNFKPIDISVINDNDGGTF
jgi:hypothetical protein|tara:strand:- start:602 stop:868 length:267 start_codon:yes stop_codon:yes gene_type:complete